jgi:hypothetical protein
MSLEADMIGPTSKLALQKFVLAEMGTWVNGYMPDRVVYNLSYSASFYAGDCNPAQGWDTVRGWLCEVAEPFEAHDGRVWWKAKARA